MNLTNKKKFIIFAVFCVLTYGAFVFLILGPGTSISDRSRFDKIVPGKTSEEKLSELYGKPAVIKKSDSTSTLFYNSSRLYQYDYVWTRSGKVVAVKEALPTNTTVETASKNLGSPDETFYDSELPEYTWLIFLKRGVAIKTYTGIAYSLIRFEPQAKDSFLSNIAPLIGITTKKVEHQGEEF